MIRQETEEWVTVGVEPCFPHWLAHETLRDLAVRKWSEANAVICPHHAQPDEKKCTIHQMGKYRIAIGRAWRNSWRPTAQGFPSNALLYFRWKCSNAGDPALEEVSERYFRRYIDEKKESHIVASRPRLNATTALSKRREVIAAAAWTHFDTEVKQQIKDERDAEKTAATVSDMNRYGSNRFNDLILTGGAAVTLKNECNEEPRATRKNETAPYNQIWNLEEDMTEFAAQQSLNKFRSVLEHAAERELTNLGFVLLDRLDDEYEQQVKGATNPHLPKVLVGLVYLYL